MHDDRSLDSKVSIAAPAEAHKMWHTVSQHSAAHVTRWNKKRGAFI